MRGGPNDALAVEFKNHPQRCVGCWVLGAKIEHPTIAATRAILEVIDVVRIDAEQNLLLVKGPVPGPNKGFLEISVPTRLYTPKATKQAAKGG